jgi:hypothetical protein
MMQNQWVVKNEHPCRSRQYLNLSNKANSKTLVTIQAFLEGKTIWGKTIKAFRTSRNLAS